MALPRPFPASPSPNPGRFSVWTPSARPVRPPSLWNDLKVRLGLASLREKELHRQALWESGRGPAGGGFLAGLIRLLGVLAVAGAILGLVWLQRRPTSVPEPPRAPSPAENTEIYFVFESEPGAENQPTRLVGGRIGVKNDEQP